MRAAESAADGADGVTLVVAHNGKCAARLTKGVEGLGGVHKLLRAKFAARAPASGGRELHLCSLWVLCVALRGALAHLSAALSQAVGNGAADEPPPLSLIHI